MLALPPINGRASSSKLSRQWGARHAACGNLVDIGDFTPALELRVRRRCYFTHSSIIERIARLFLHMRRWPYFDKRSRDALRLAWAHRLKMLRRNQIWRRAVERGWRYEEASQTAYRCHAWFCLSCHRL